MNEINLIYIVLPLLIIIQSIIGVGILVIGTPFMLLVNYDIISTLSLLLPVSLITSFLNILLIKNDKRYKNIKIDYLILKNFFIICLPSIFIGLVILYFFSNYINFKLIIAAIILISLLFKIIYEKIFSNINYFFVRIFMFIVGIVHGLTNSGGALLMLFLNYINKEKNKNSRQNMTFFYFYLVFFQYLIFFFLFNEFHEFKLDLVITALIFFGTTIGFFAEKFVNKNIFQLLVNFTAFVAAVSLIIF